MKFLTPTLLAALALSAFLPVLSGQTTPPVITLYSFGASGGGIRSSDGEGPLGGLIQASNGNFYGTTENGGPNGYGTIFRITSAGELTTMYFFTNRLDGAYPLSALVEGSDGNYYGTAGDGVNNGGTIFRITPGGVFTALGSFTSGGSYVYGNGGAINSSLLQGADGNFYGTTTAGGSQDYGTVFRVTPGGVLTVLHAFTDSGSEGAYPFAPVILGDDGNFYGTTTAGGTYDSGTVFQLTPDGILATLHSFSDHNDGAGPRDALLQASDGNFYGTTAYGGANSNGSASQRGTFFQLTPGDILTPLYDFTNNDTDAESSAAPIQASDGNFYFSAFEVIPDGAAPTGFRVVENAPGARGTLVQGRDGYLYGTTESGGAHDAGSVFRINLTLPDVVQFHTKIYSVNEFADTALVRVDRLGGIAAASVQYQTADDTAKAGTDYQSTNGELDWAAYDQRPQFIKVPILKRGITNGVLRTLSLTLSGASGGVGLGYPSTAKLTISDTVPAPVITSAVTATAMTGQVFNYQIAATNGPTRFGGQGLPGWLTVDAATGKLSGTPPAAGSFTATVNAVNSGGRGVQSLTLTIIQPPPVITNAPTATGTAGEPFSYQITATNHPVSFGAQGLPAGLRVDPATGIISGTRTVAGTFPLTLNAYNSGGQGSASLTLEIVPKPVPTITSATTATATVGQPFTYTITASDYPTSFGVQGLPSGLSVDSSTGVISGTRKVPGTITLTLNAYNSTGEGSATLTLTVQ